MRGVAVLTSLVLTAMPALAAAEGTVSEAAQAMVGGWEISNVDRDRRCALTFSIEPGPGGFKIEIDGECPAAFPALGNVVAWTFGPKDVLRLIDAQGGALMQFTEVENGMFESERGPEGLLFLQTQAALKIELRSVEQIVGDWSLLREADKPLCRLTLSDTALGEGTYRIVVKPGCGKGIAAFGLTTWRLDRDHLVLTGQSGSWRFSESDGSVWERVPLSTDPLLLVRQ
ncbi:MAG: AprI/Inh family metalloprotease inhibitor [Hyphomicrobiales bacterium]|nr:AprI/Inh family metalloprotease inhibitor [Hyphomicrobiales bacterium]